MLTRLALETRDDGYLAATERVALFVPPTIDGYRRFLASISVFEFAVEAELVRTISAPVGLLRKVIKSGNCTDDLLWLGEELSVASIAARPCRIPRFGDLVEALGWMYMLERNRLSSDDTLAILGAQLSWAFQSASRYLRACIERHVESWRELGIWLDRTGRDASAAKRIVVAAREAFQHHHRWYGGEGDEPDPVDTREPAGGPTTRRIRRAG